jgi:cell division protease FtsH
VRRIVEEAHDDVVRLLTDHREKLDSLTQRLLERETIDEDEAYEAAGVARERSEAVEMSSAAATGTVAGNVSNT